MHDLSSILELSVTTLIINIVNLLKRLYNNIPFLTVGYVKKGEKCLFKGIFLPFKIVVWEASYEIFLIFLLRSLG